jgi:hypothetical protein
MSSMNMFKELFPFEREIEAYICTPIFYAHSRFTVGTIS